MELVKLKHQYAANQLLIQSENRKEEKNYELKFELQNENIGLKRRIEQLQSDEDQQIVQALDMVLQPEMKKVVASGGQYVDQLLAGQAETAEQGKRPQKPQKPRNLQQKSAAEKQPPLLQSQVVNLADRVVFYEKQFTVNKVKAQCEDEPLREVYTKLMRRAQGELKGMLIALSLDNKMLVEQCLRRENWPHWGTVEGILRYK